MTTETEIPPLPEIPPVAGAEPEAPETTETPPVDDEVLSETAERDLAETEKEALRAKRMEYMQAQHGITEDQIQQWKSEFKKLGSIHIGGQLYIYRPLFREEYVVLMSCTIPDEIANNPVKVRQFNEDETVKRCLLFPQFMGSGLQRGLAGTINVLADLIMNMSGFLPDDVPIEF